MTDLNIILGHLGFAIDRDYTLGWDGSQTVIEWRSAQPQPTPAEIDAARKPAGLAVVKQRIKAEAQARILYRLPQWKQNNATARAVELMSLGQASGPEWDALQAAWAWVKATRLASDQHEAAAALLDDPLTYDYSGGWPEA